MPCSTPTRNYGELATLREPLKYSFRLTLTLVLLLAMLSAIYLAIRSAQRLTRPVHDLIQGTRAVGKGDFEHAAAAALARRNGLPGAVVQRHDQAPAPRQRGGHAQPRSWSSRSASAWR